MAVGAIDGNKTRVEDDGVHATIAWSAPSGSSWAPPLLQSGDEPILLIDPGGANERLFVASGSEAPVIDGDGALNWRFVFQVQNPPPSARHPHQIHKGEAVQLTIAAGAVEDSALNTTAGASGLGISNGSGFTPPALGRDYRSRWNRGRPGAG
jgi:hypothetical protein